MAQTPSKNVPTPPESQGMPSLLDKEISSSSSDAFGHRHFAEALRGLVESSLHAPPFSIGLLGRWGTGKSSIKALYLAALGDDRTKNASGKIRSERIHTITFNAWRYGGENIRRALLRHIYCEIGGDDVEIMDKLFNQLQVPTPVPKTWKAIWWEVYDKWPWMALQLIAVPTIAVLGTLLAAKCLGLGEAWAIAGIFAIQVIAGAFLTGTLLDPKRFAISRYTSVTRVELPKASAEQYEHMLVGQLKEFKKKRPSNERIIVFLDDLDRLSSEEMVSGLDAVRALMEITFEQQDGVGIIFVISCDEERIAEALANRRKQNPDLPGAIQTHYDARRYLDRIFQFRLEIPPFPRQDMRSYVLSRLNGELPSIAAGIAKTGASVDEVVSRMIHVGVQSPRNALQILNAFVQAWWVAERREREGAGTDKRGALGEGAVTKYPVALATLCALHVDFPDFYNDLLQEPQLAIRFTDVYARKASLSDQPEGVRILLEKYAKKRPAESEEPLALDSKHRPLRQFLTSISGVTWPNSILPLLLLSQDPVTRRMGDSAARVYDALVSGDAEGVLADLGRDNDGKPLSIEDVQLLLDLWEDSGHETEDRRDNAATVLSNLAERYPKSEAPRLLIPLAHRLADSQEVRWRVGVSGIGRILDFIAPEDRRSLASRLIGDLLKLEGSVEFRLPQGGAPSLDEAVAMAKEAVDLALRVQDKDQLPQAARTSLSEWLLVRSVSVRNATQNLPFGALEGWTLAHEKFVTESLGLRYAEALVQAVEANDPGLPPPQAIVDRSLRLLREAHSQGEDSRREAWALASRYGAAENEAANTVADEVLRQFGEGNADCGATVAAIATRLSPRVENAQAVSTTEDISIRGIKHAVEKCRSLPDFVIHAMAVLGGKLGMVPGYETNAIGFASTVIGANSASARELLTDWAAHATTDLRDACLDFLAAHYGDMLGEGERNLLNTQLNAVAQGNAASEEQARRYVRLINGIAPGDFKIEPLNTHANNALAWMAGLYGNSTYLKWVAPALPKLVEVGAEAAAGSTLHTLFANTRNAPEPNADLHQQMIGRWPNQNPSMAPYDPNSIFTWASQLIAGSANAESTPVLLASMRDMVSRQIVPPENAELLKSAALASWPYFPQDAAVILMGAADTLAAAQAADLSETTSSADPTAMSQLRSIWSNYAKRYDQPARLTVVSRLLTHPVKAGQPSPDPFMEMWLAIASADLPAVFGMTLDSEQFNDDQRQRIWNQLISHAGTLNQKDVLDSLGELLTHPESPDTIRVAIEGREELNNVFTTGEDKYKLEKILLRSMIHCTSAGVKNMVAKWLGELGNPGVLNEIHQLGTPTQEDIDILRRTFPNSKELKDL